MMFKFRGKTYGWTCPTWMKLVGILGLTVAMWIEIPM